MAAMSKIVYFSPVSRILVVAFDGAQTLDVTGPAEVFASASREAGHAAYRVVIATSGGGAFTTSCAMQVVAADLHALRPSSEDTVVVAGGGEAPLRAAMADARLLGWLSRAASRVRRMSSVCSGAFLLAAAGLLQGKRAATHWAACDRLARSFPAVDVDRRAIFLREGSLWTSAGVTTGIDMALAMVEEDLGRAVADRVAAQLVLYVRRPGFQPQWSAALVAQARASEGLERAIAWARANLSCADVDTLARQAGLSVRTLHRRCREELRTTPAKLLERLRLEQARALIGRGEPAKRVADDCGFGNVARMKRAFQRELGMGPRDYRLLHG
jgi:transcriptional regulator GlxA family with amidase domain